MSSSITKPAECGLQVYWNIQSCFSSFVLTTLRPECMLKNHVPMSAQKAAEPHWIPCEGY
ncbi:unnamed protein product [Acanthoscelides obtectus]|uniref:Uncharacterized protein n=1 Tax=Acanthoscelides obtectus TaxID=200917 RepID=A0A9P0K6T9_ACAOB|nr:unnamed protein product [Acanthoscelides obtectus]CAK1666578.1 hypothetical protein AOBTE_LOCUS25379 [Acanthoscelides obtectus]